MSLELIKFAFVSGELSPTFLGRSDLEKFDLGLAEAKNFFVDYRGGLTTRPGTIFGDYIPEGTGVCKMFEFKYAPDIANTYLMLFGPGFIRFIQDNAYVLEAAKAVTALSLANPGVMTSPAHGFGNNQWVKIAGIAGMENRTFILGSVTTNTFQLIDPGTMLPIDTSTFAAYVAGGTVARVYTVSTPYASGNIAGLSITQYRDLVRITSLDFPIYNLVRAGHTNWTLTPEIFNAAIAQPVNVSSAPSAAGTSGVGFIVTAVDASGNESLPSAMHLQLATVDYTTTAGQLQLSWNSVIGAAYYNVYRTIITAAVLVNRSMQVGYIGRSYGASFVDNNIIPDFTRSPPKRENPFANGAIIAVDVVTGGTGYTQTDTISLTGGGTGFQGSPVVDPNGIVVGVRIDAAGANYVAPTAAMVSGTGSGATFNVYTTPLTNNAPALSARFQQRQIYASSRNRPLNVWGSQPGRLSNFDSSDIVLDSDAFEFELDTDEVSPIKHMLSVRGGLLLLTQGGIWLLNGGQNGQPLTPTQALAEPHTYTGISEVPPIKIDTDLLYVESKGFTVRLLSYNDFSNIYAGQDISILSNHLFSAQNHITRWAFASDPFKLVWGRRQDGAMLMFTMVKEQNVFAWTRAYTRGIFEDIISIQENSTDAVYFLVRRLINGRWVRFFEKVAPRIITAVENAHCVDAGLSLGATYPNATLSAPTNKGNPLRLTASAAVFSAGDVGKVIRFGGGKMYVTAYVSTTQVDVNVVQEITLVIPEHPLNQPMPAAAGTWTKDAVVSTVGGLWHLEGETVKVLLDGNVVSPDPVVVNGRISLGVDSGTRIIVGIPYSCVAKTLPLSIAQATVENRRKRIMGLGLRLHQSRGLKAGNKLSKLYPLKERGYELYGEPTNLLTQMKNVLVQPEWDNDGSLYIVQDFPLPASILGFVASVEVGDDPD